MGKWEWRDLWGVLKGLHHATSFILCSRGNREVRLFISPNCHLPILKWWQWLDGECLIMHIPAKPVHANTLVMCSHVFHHVGWTFSKLVMIIYTGLSKLCFASKRDQWGKWTNVPFLDFFTFQHCQGCNLHEPIQYIPRNMHTVLLCFALLWLCNRS